MNNIPTSSNIHRNKIERQRQYDIDEEIQKLMCFLPNRPLEQKMSRNQILEELYKVAVEQLSDVHVQPAAHLERN